MGVGVLPIRFFNSSTTFGWITGKYSLPLIEDKLNFSIGGMGGSVLGENFGVIYGMATYGSRSNSVSAGLGKGITRFASTDWVFILSGSLRLAKGFYVITENYLIPEENLNFLGARVMLGRGSLDLGVGSFDGNDGFPMLGITVPLHGKHKE